MTSGANDSPASKAFAARLAKYAFEPPVAGRGRRSSQRPGPSASDGQPSPVTPGRAKASPARTPKRRRGSLSSLTSDEEAIRAGGTDAATFGQKGDDLVSEAGPSMVKSSRQGHGECGDGGREDASKGPSGGKKTKKVPRPYAGPEVYAHLKNTPDHLAVGLDSKKSASTGTHFAHPTNKFWRALHLSGLTPRLYAPAECHLLPQALNYGLTNLCGRPTAEQSELSTLEMRLNVHPFATKIARLRPRIVCFVGKKIWEVFEAVAGKTAIQAVVSDAAATPSRRGAASAVSGVDGTRGSEAEEDVKLEVEDMSLQPKLEVDPTGASHSIGMADISGPTSEDPHFEPDSDALNIKPVLAPSPPRTPLRRLGASSLSTAPSPASPAGRRSAKAATQPFDWMAPRTLRLPLPLLSDTTGGAEYCYFWVTPSTSGLERTPMAEQANIFSALRRFSESLQAGDPPPTQAYRDIDLAAMQLTSDKIRTDAIAKGTVVHPSVHA